VALFQTPVQTILKKGNASVVEVHAAFLIDESLQEFQFCFGQCGRFAYVHVSSVIPATSRPLQFL
jgi:hypothetical protein